MRGNDGGAHLFFLLKRAHHQLSVYAARQVSTATGAQAAQVAALVQLERSDRCSVRELGELLGLNSAGTTGLVGRLERKKLVERRASKQDGRVTEVRLTARGRAIVGDVAPLLSAIGARMRGTFEPREIAVIERFLEHVLTAFGADGEAIAKPPAPSKGAKR